MNQIIGNVSDTAFMVAGFRALETERPDALFRDPLATKLSGQHGRNILTTVPGGFVGAWTVIIDALIPSLFCALPRARRLTAWEYAPSNIAWLEAELRRNEMRTQWHHAWDVTREAYLPEHVLTENPLPALREKTTLHQGSIFELPERNWDAATMFFCAESITGRRDEFDAACAAYARCVRGGGTLAAAFLVGTSRYVIADRPFPILCLSAEEIESTFARHAINIKAERIGIVDREIRSGYSGFVFLTGVAR